MNQPKNISKKELFSALEKKHKDIDTILHTISHDLRGPVSTILGINNIIDTNSSKEELSQYLEIIHKLALDLDSKMANTVELLSIANIESRKTELIPDKLFESIFMELTNSLDDYSFKFKHTGNPTITIEKELFYQSTKNLLDCIYSFTTTPKKSIQLFSNASENALKMTIISNIRLTRETYETLSRILNGTAKIYSKTGMKLHLAKIYLKRLEGEILFTPGKDKTTINVLVPLNNRTELEI